MEDKVDRKKNARKKYKEPGVKRVRLDGEGSVLACTKWSFGPCVEGTLKS